MDSNGALTLEQETQHVQLGQDTYEVVPQPMPYLKRSLGTLFEGLGEMDIEEDGLGAFITGKSHEILKVFIPDLMPLHLWEGFRSEQDMADDNYDAEHARRVAPTGPQVRLALTVCLKVNGLDLVGQLGKLVDPTVLRQLATRYLIAQIEEGSSGRRLPTTSSVSTPESGSEKSSMTSSPDSPASEPSAV